MEGYDFKFGRPQGTDVVPFSHRNVWNIEQTPKYERLIIAPSSSQIDLLLKLTATLPGPFGILYVLTVSRTNHQVGRYQNPQPASRLEMESFIRDFQNFLENDGRHHLWISSLPSSSTLVYDNHNVIYAYGQHTEFIRVLAAEGLSQGQVTLPDPHTHNYNPMFDADEDRVLSYWNWRLFPLADSDE